MSNLLNVKTTNEDDNLALSSNLVFQVGDETLIVFEVVGFDAPVDSVATMTIKVPVEFKG